jgi:probable rRNA maturation factor
MLKVEIDLTDDWDDTEDWQALSERAVAAAFAVAGFAPSAQLSLSINLSDDDEIHALNAQWRGKDKPTNVLSFPMLEGEELEALEPPRNGEGHSREAGAAGHAQSLQPSEAQANLHVPLHHASHGPPPPLGEVLLGDLILAHGVCTAEAAEKAIPLAQHVTHLIIHGTLHLLGLDHIDDAEAEAMEALEVKALASLGLPNPY